MTVTATEADAMRRAIALSALGLGSTSPNPPVGCVILDRDGQTVGESYHQRKGEPHAEANALTAAGPRAVGGTAVVTLEPCNHHGRTPPCHQALIDAGIARVLIALIDPTSRGDGGAARLRDAGVQVEVDVLADDALVVLGPWLEAQSSGRPRVLWTYEYRPEGPHPCPNQLLAHIRVGVDAVLNADGRVEEGILGAHGPGAFTLPASVPAHSPAEALATLYSGGVRSLLLHGGTDLAEPFLQQRLVDSISVLLSTSDPSTQHMSQRTTRTPGFLPDSFRIHSIHRHNTGLFVHANFTASRSLRPKTWSNKSDE